MPIKLPEGFDLLAIFLFLDHKVRLTIIQFKSFFFKFWDRLLSIQKLEIKEVMFHKEEAAT